MENKIQDTSWTHISDDPDDGVQVRFTQDAVVLRPFIDIKGKDIALSHKEAARLIYHYENFLLENDIKDAESCSPVVTDFNTICRNFANAR